MVSLDTFLKKYGKGKHHGPIDLSNLSEYDQFWFIPEVMVLLEHEGISSYMDGFLWTLNPLEYVDWLNEWVYFEERCLPFARTAFGDILFIREKVIMILNSNKGLIDFATDDVEQFFNWYLTDDWYLNRYFNKEIYDQMEQRPKLKQDECLGYVSLLSDGGSEDVTNLEVVNLKSYLERVSKASEGIRFFQ